jgi:hypothetical protein
MATAPRYDPECSAQSVPAMCDDIHCATGLCKVLQLTLSPGRVSAAKGGGVSVLSGEHRISEDLTVEFEFDAASQSVNAHWMPYPPPRLSGEELAAYRRTRNEFLQQLAAQRGAPVTVLRA